MSEIVTIEPPQDRAVTLEEARQQLRLDGRDEDLLLGAKLDAAQAELEQQTGLKLCEQTLELQLEDWLDEITVPIRPCSVAEIRYTATSGATVTLPETDSDTARAGVEQGNSIITTGIKAVEAVVNAIRSLPFPLNIAAGAVTAGVIASLGVAISGAFGGSAKPPVTNDGTGTVFGDHVAQRAVVIRQFLQAVGERQGFGAAIDDAAHGVDGRERVHGVAVVAEWGDDKTQHPTGGVVGELLVKEGRRTQRPRPLDTEHDGQAFRQDPEPLEDPS